MHEQEWMEKLKAEGFRDLVIVSLEPSADFNVHAHDQHTVHVILKGALILQEDGGVRTLAAGEQFEFPAGTTHGAKFGPDGCTMIVGQK